MATLERSSRQERVMVRSESVLDYVTESAENVMFSNATQMGVGCVTIASIPMDKWRDMGEPDVITVTVQPGDRLNDEPREDDSADSADSAESGIGGERIV